jgi:hypothetical protein
MIKGGQRYQNLPPFTRVEVKDTFNVSLHTGYSRPQLILRGDARDLPHVVTMVSHGVLKVKIEESYTALSPIQLEIDAHYLNAFKYQGVGEITGYHLNTSLLDLALENKGRTILKGNIGLRKLEIKGDSFTDISGINSPMLMVMLSGNPRVRLSGILNLASLDMSKGGSLTLYWVKSKVLNVIGKEKAFIQLAGVVEHLNLELWGAAQFKGRYLRADHAFVKTHDKSVAQISCLKQQHTLAKDASDIQFFNIPVMKSDFMGQDGAVLDMRDLAFPFVEEYDQYNK